MITDKLQQKLIPIPSIKKILLSFFLGLILTTSTSAKNYFSQIPLTVIDAATGEAIIGAHVYTQDSSFQAVTDINGQVVLEDIGYRDIVYISYIGYETINLPLFEIRKMNGTIRLSVDATVLEGVVVVGRKDDPEEEIPYLVDRITAKDITFSNAQTTVDAINKNGDVFIQKSQLGGGSPVIRGFEANKVLLVVDGVRMNNAIYRGGHLQNSITLDNSIMEQIEVIHGPGSLLYGSDALGGVVHFRTKDPQLLFDESPSKNHRLNTNVYTKFSTANLGQNYHLDFNYGTRKVGWLFSGSYSDYKDLRTGSRRPEEFPTFGERRHYVVIVPDSFNPDQLVDQVKNKDEGFDIQNTTGYKQIDVLTKLRIQPNDNFYLVGNFQYSTSSNVPRFDNLTDTLENAGKLKWSEWNYGPQTRMLASLKARILKSNSIYDRATFIASYQDVFEERLSRKYNRFLRTFNQEYVDVYALTADFDKFFDEQERYQLSYGGEVNHNIIKSEAGKINISNEKQIKRGEFTRYPSGGSTMTTYAGYLYYRWRSANDVFVFNAGSRYSKIAIDARFSPDDPIQWNYSSIQTEMTDLTGSVGFTINTKDKWQVRLLGARAFRAPNLNDFASVRPKNGFITVPNANLQPEKAWNGELTLAKEFGKIREDIGTTFKISGTGFYTYLTDAIVRIDSTLFGEPILQTEDGPQTIQTHVNASTGFIYGLSANVKLNINNKWSLTSNLNYIKGRNQFTTELIDTLVPLAHIPPMYGRTSLTYQNKKWRLELMSQYNAAKPVEEYAISSISRTGDGDLKINRIGTSDNLEYTPIYRDENGDIQHNGAYAWNTFNFYSAYQISPKFSINLAVENILDVHYRTFSSGLSAPGRNFSIGLYGNF